MPLPSRFDSVAIDTKANIYFDGKVVSHSVFFSDGSKKTLGLIYPGSFRFNTDAPELMEIVSGTCRVRISDEPTWQTISAGNSFKVPGKSAFDIEVKDGIAEYICSFIK